MRSLARRAPYTVWAYASLLVAVLLWILFFETVDGWLFAGGGFMLLCTAGLVAGIWFPWLVLVVIHFGSLLISALERSFLSSVVINAILAGLLLARPTRAHVRRARIRS